MFVTVFAKDGGAGKSGLAKHKNGLVLRHLTGFSAFSLCWRREGGRELPGMPLQRLHHDGL